MAAGRRGRRPLIVFDEKELQLRFRVIGGFDLREGQFTYADGVEDVLAFALLDRKAMKNEARAMLWPR